MTAAPIKVQSFLANLPLFRQIEPDEISGAALAHLPPFPMFSVRTRSLMRPSVLSTSCFATSPSAPCAPSTLEMLSQFSVLTRLRDEVDTQRFATTVTGSADDVGHGLGIIIAALPELGADENGEGGRGGSGYTCKAVHDDGCIGEVAGEIEDLLDLVSCWCVWICGL